MKMSRGQIGRRLLGFAVAGVALGACGAAFAELGQPAPWEYTLQESATVGSRNLQVFTPSVPPGTRSLTIRSADDGGARPVVTFAVPLMAVPEPQPEPREAGGSPATAADESYQPDLRRPA